jgi:hypothetical protein
MPLYRVVAEQSIIYEQYVRADSEEDAKAIARSEGEWEAWDMRGHDDEMTIIDISIEEGGDEL